MVVLPPVPTPVTTPPVLIVAAVGLVLVQVPPARPSLKVSVPEPRHKDDPPVIAPGVGFTVSDIVYTLVHNVVEFSIVNVPV